MPITSTIPDDVFGSDLPIAFATNVEGFNDAGFAGAIARRGWPELNDSIPRAMGSWRTHTLDGRTLYAICCHSIDDGTWDYAAITRALDEIAATEPGPLAVVWMGRGVIGRLLGADPDATRAAIDQANIDTHLYYQQP